MGFTVAHASSAAHPMPTTPVLAEANLRLFRRRWALASGIRTALLTGSFTCLTVVLFGDPGPGALVRSNDSVMPALITAAAVWLLATRFSFGTSAPLARWAGSAAAGSVRRAARTRPPAELSDTNRAGYWMAAALAAPLALACASAFTDPPPVRLAVAAAVVCAAAVGAASAAIRLLVRSRAGFAAVRERHAQVAAVRAAAPRETARITAVEFRQRWNDDLPVFSVRAALDSPDGAEFTVHLCEYPLWAPAPGNILHLWRDPDAPSDLGRAVVERPVAGQDRIADPERLRRPQQGHEDAAPGPIAPTWALPVPPATRVRHAIGCVAALVAVLTVGAATALRLAAIDPVPGWLPVLYLACLASTLMVASWWLAPWVGPRSALRSGTDRFTASFIAVALPAGIVVEMLWRLMVMPGDRLQEDVSIALAVVLLAFLAGGICLTLGITYDTYAKVVTLATNPGTVEPALVIDALRSGDPDPVRRLREEHGYTVGLLHLSLPLPSRRPALPLQSPDGGGRRDAGDHPGPGMRAADAAGRASLTPAEDRPLGCDHPGRTERAQH